MKSCRRVFQLCMVAWLAFLLNLNANAAEDTFAVDLQADRKNVHVADPVWITLSATAPQGWKVEFPKTPDAFGELKVIETVDQLQESDAETFTATTRFKLESLLPGRYQVDPLEVRFTSNDVEDDPERSAEPIERSTEPLMIRVHSAIGLFESRQVRDIDGTVRIPWTWWQWAAVAIVVIAVVAIGWMVYRSIDRWLGSPRINQRSLLQQLDRLDEARLKRLISNDQLIISVADVVRQSLRLDEGRQPFYRTTDEWIEHLEKTHSAQAASSAGDPGLLEAVELVLREADAIKFAGKAATLDQARRSLDAARTIVRSFFRERTDPTETTPNEGTVPEPSPR